MRDRVPCMRQARHTGILIWTSTILITLDNQMQETDSMHLLNQIHHYTRILSTSSIATDPRERHGAKTLTAGESVAIQKRCCHAGRITSAANRHVAPLPFHCLHLDHHFLPFTPPTPSSSPTTTSIAWLGLQTSDREALIFRVPVVRIVYLKALPNMRSCI